MEVICHSGLSPSPEEEETSCLRNTLVLLSFTKWCPGRKEKESESCSVVSNSLWPHGLYSSWDSPGRDTGVGSLSLLQEFFPIQGSSPCLPNFRWILYQLKHQGSPRILEWVAYPFSGRIFPTQELKRDLLHCRQNLYQLSHKGSPRILERVATPSPADLPDPGIEPRSPALQVDSLPNELSESIPK